MAATWKGTISFGLVEIPVELHPAEEREETKTTMLDKRDLSPVGYKRFNKVTGEEVEYADIVSGFEHEKGQYVILTDAEREAAHPRATHSIEILEFVELHEIDPIFFERPYYIRPGKTGGRAYPLLRETLRRTGKVAVAKLVLRTKQYLAAITVHEDALMLNLLRYAHEIRDSGPLNLPAAEGEKSKVSPAEVKMAEELVASMTTTWEPEKFHNEYRDQLLEVIDTKAREGKVHRIEEPLRESEKSDRVLDLMAALKRSVLQKEQEQKGQKPAAKPRKRKRA